MIDHYIRQLIRDEVRAAVKEALETKAPSSLALLEPDDAAKLMGVTRTTIIRWARRGEIPHRRTGRGYRFVAAELQAWSDRRKAG